GEYQTAALMCAPPPQPPSPRTEPTVRNPPLKLATESRARVPLETLGRLRAVQARPSGDVQMAWAPPLFVPNAMYPAAPPAIVSTAAPANGLGIARRVQARPLADHHIAWIDSGPPHVSPYGQARARRPI